MMRRLLVAAAVLLAAAIALYFLFLREETGRSVEAGSLIAFDASTGRELWHVRPPMALPGKPAVSERVVLVEGGNDCNSTRARVIAFDLASGKERWRRSVDSSDSCGNVTFFVHEGVAAVQDGGRVLGIEAETGKVIWQHGLARSSDGSSGHVERLDTGGVVVIRESSYYRGLDRRTGKELWSIDAIGLAGLSWASPETFILGGFFPGTGICRLRAIDLTTGAEKWQTPLKAACAVKPIGIGEQFVVGCSGTGDPEEPGTSAGLDARTGAPLWQKEMPCTDAFLDDGRALINMRNPPEALRALDPAAGAELWRIDNSSTSAIVAEGGLLLLFPEGLVSALDGASGRQLWQAIRSGSGISPDGTISNGIAYVVAAGEPIPRRTD